MRNFLSWAFVVLVIVGMFTVNDYLGWASIFGFINIAFYF